MTETKSISQSFINLTSGIGALIIGLSLVVVGALALTHAAYMTWELYKNPETIISFAQSLKLANSNIVDVDLGGLDPLRLIAWPFVVLLLLLQGRIGLWAIEAGARILDTARQK